MSALGRKYSRATIFRDLEEVRPYVMQHFKAERDWLISKSLAELDEWLKIAWRCVDLAGPRTKKGLEVDVSFRRLAALDRLMQLQARRNALAGIGPIVISQPSGAIGLEQFMGGLINSEPDPQIRKALTALVERNAKLEEAQDDNKSG